MSNFTSGRRLLRFAVVADSHLNPVNAGNTSPWQTNHLANPRNEVVVAAINRIAPAFTVHVGDVVHPLPHSTDYDGAADFATTLYRGLQAPFYIAPGNHDIGDKHLPGNPAACISADSCDKYEQHFGAQWQAFTEGNVCFIIINACLLGSGLPQEDAQWQFLQSRLAEEKAAGRRLFLFTHYPPFVTAPDEENHYDNIDHGPRRRLLELTASAGVEALFAGHVHTFFLNRHAGMWSYALPSSTNFRQDYAELFRVEPGEELGRNDLGKFGFFVVDIHEHGHIARFVRTYGSTDPAQGEEIALQVEGDVREHAAGTVAADFRHDWARVEALPYNPPLDAFVRKRVRNDYYILNLWDAGMRGVRLPIHDIADEQAFERVRLLGELGHRCLVFGTAVPDARLLERLASLGPALEGYEWIGPDSAIAEHATGQFARRGIRLFVAPVMQPPSSHSQGQYDHNMTSGIALGELDHLARFRPQRPDASAPGVVVRIAGDEPVLESVRQAVEQAASLGVAIALHINLANRKSALVNDDDQAQAARVAETAIAKAAYPDVPMTLDTFMDIDRGYFARHGLVDRRNNPRPAATVLRRLSERLRGHTVRIGAITREPAQSTVRIALGDQTLDVRIGRDISF
ncbi:hypothetical protein B7P02_01800 [Bordetella bronchiseptica]|uniref:metallophosphoesterase n=1 Tax=Bordetella bronchiseptica TaxID=518 RepID=UPI000459F779|nr:metallophosphoesterase [Bordetella bronchiseptica]AUL13704.1 hypothetical protein BTL45_01800 [Bordetella bronchiseptica]AWP56794.1 hypothetical protein B7P02_01800 [Bordetella bronchiseptica]KAK74816.1 calcineurin-like phosphoesterase family protein [Bordetella bronchiseptica CA90 BB02]KDC25576.1 calcineurin-like phosphoesterase family protein [Bordetella bronchiseptica F4563]RSB97571.1 hypothetical protein EGT31_04960 [Bordetella bronchiseptica]